MRGLVPLALAFSATAASAQQVTLDSFDERRIHENELRLQQQSPRALINNGVIQRLRPEYDALGYNLGAFRVYPKMSAELGYDSNIFQTTLAAVPDEELIIRPSLSAQSNWERHSLSLDASSSIERFANHSAANIEDYDVGLKGVLDFGVGGHLHGAAQTGYDHEDRGSIGDLFPGGQPVRFHRQHLAGGVEEHFPGLFVALDGDLTRYRYDDVDSQGVTFPQSYRDRDERNVKGQAAFRIAPRMAFFTEVSANNVRYKDKGAADFNSHGQQILAGVTFQVPSLLSGEIGIGYIRQKYEDLPLGPVSGLSYDLSVLWNATPLLTATVDAHRSVQQTPYSQAPSIIESRFGMRLDYELLRNLLVNAQGTVTRDDFGAGYSVDTRYNAGLGVRYLINHTFSTNLAVEWRKQRANSSFLRAYEGTAVRFGVTAQH